MLLRNDLTNELSQKFYILFHCLRLDYLEGLRIYRTVPAFIEKIDTEDGKARLKYQPVSWLIYHVSRVDANRTGRIVRKTAPSRENHLIGARFIVFFCYVGQAFEGNKYWDIN